MKILLTGGGSGGHVAPILAVVSEIKHLTRQKNMEVPEFVFITPDEYFSEAIEKANIRTKKIKAGKLRRYFDLENISDAIKILIGIFQSVLFIWKYKPDVVFSKGGFASVPVVFASWILCCPVITHESDITPGLANRINSFFASKVLISFAETQKYFKKSNTVLTGNPVREDMSAGSVEAGRRIFGINEDLPTLLVFGGSQGARRINEAILDALESLIAKFNVIHICGKGNFTSVKEKSEKKGLQNIKRYKPYPFLHDEMKDAYAVCEIIVSRAGANSISEIIEVGKPSLIIPLAASANDHQVKNARWLMEKGLARVMSENELSGEKLYEAVMDLFESEKKDGNISAKLIEYKKSSDISPAHEIAQAILAGAK